MTGKEAQSQARVMGAAKAAALTGYTQDVVSRWMNGGINAQVEQAFIAAMAQ